MGTLTLVLGGVRSGKSRFAERLAQQAPPVIYLATALPGDAEMRDRIADHQRRRETFSPPWTTVEEAWDLPGAVRQHGSAAGCLVLECVTLWLTNLLVGVPPRSEMDDEAILNRVDALIEAGKQGKSRLIVVSNETGCGITPLTALARRFSDILGETNQRLAHASEEVYFCVAGIPWKIKG